MTGESSFSSASLLQVRHNSESVVWVWTGLLLAAVVLSIGAYAYYRHETDRIRQDKYREIAVIAELKTAQIQQWRQAQLQDVQAVATGPLFKKSVSDWFRDKARQTSPQELQDRLATIQRTREYADAVLFDVEGHVLLSATDQSHLMDDVEEKAAREAIANRSPVLTDIYRTSGGVSQIAAVAPLLDSEDRPIAVVLLRTNPESMLYPLIRIWPTPSRTSETLLVRKDGDHILYLNDLRHKPDSALSLREPLTHPIGQALLGRQGLYEGKDYRGLEVLADLRPIPNSPWFMMAKIDAMEIVAEARHRAAIIGVSILFFILLAGAAAAYGYRRRQARVYRILYESEKNRREAQEHFRTILYSIGDAVITTDVDGVVKQMNPVAEAFTGWTEAEATGRLLKDVFLIVDRETHQPCGDRVKRVLRTGMSSESARQTVLIGRDGAERIIAESAAPIRDERGGTLGVVLMFRDVTDEVRSAGELHSRDETLRAILTASPVGILLTRDQKIQWANDSCIRMFGFESEEEYLNRPTRSLHPSEDDYEAVRNRLYSDFEPRRVSEADAKFIRKDGTSFAGHLRINLLDPSDPSKGEIAVITDISDRKKAAEDLEASEHKFRTMVDWTYDWEYWLDPTGRIVYISPSCERVTGYSPQEFTDDPSLIERIVHTADRPAYERHTRDFYGVNEPGQEASLEFRIIARDKTEHWIEHICRPVYGEDGSYLGKRASNREISDRKQAEDELQKLASVVRHTRELVSLATFDGRMIFLNESGCGMLGIEPANVRQHDIFDVIPEHLLSMAQTELLPALMAGGSWEGDLQYLNVKTGGLTDVHAMFFVIREAYTGSPICLANISRDITESKRVEKRIQRQGAMLAAINSVLLEALESDTDADIAKTCLRKAEEITGSKFGFIGEVNQGGRLDIIAISDPGWTACRIPQSDSILSIKNMVIRGIWATALKREQSVIINSPAFHPDAVGIPDGHPILNSFMGVPLKRSEVTFGVIALANKEEDYDSYDVADIETLSSVFVEALDRSRTERALEASEEKYRNIFDNIVEGIFQSTPEGRFITLNPSYAKMFGYQSPQQMIGEVTDIACQLWANPADREEYKRLLDENGFIEDFEFESRTREGTPLWISVSAKAIQDARGRIRYYEGTCQDITARKQAEQALRRSEALLKEAQRIAHIGHWEINSPADKPTWSEEIFNIFGLDPAKGEPSFIDHRKFIHPDDWKRLNDSMIRGMQQGVPFDVEFRCIHPDQSIRWLNAKGYSIKDENGDFFRMFGTAQDITERKMAKQALLESEERYRQITENSLTGIFLYQDGRSIYANKRLAEMVGFTPEGVLSIPFLEVIHPDDREMVMEMAKARLSDKPVPNSYELRLLHKDGHTVWSKVMSHRIFYHGQPAILGNIVDISESRLLEDQLRQAQKMEAIGTLAGGVAHDFNNVLQVVLGYSDFLLDDKYLPSHYRSDLQKIQESARHGADLVRRLLTFSRKTEIKLQPLDLNRRIAEIRKMLERTISKMINIELFLGEDLWRINADPIQIDQVLMNLAVNARDAMPEGGKLIIETDNIVLDEEYTKMHVDGKPGNHILLKITDTGAGMDKQTLEHIFEPFYTTKEAGRGTGLGLAVVHGIVQQHGGHVRCYSEPDRGTVFKIYFPALIYEDERKVRTAGIKPRGGSETILLVDDETFISDLGSRILTKAGYNVITASNGKQALEIYMAKGHEIDLVILDLIMPEMSGRQCLEELRGIDPFVKAVVASGYSAIGPMDDALMTGARGFIKKPYEIREMLELVRSALDEDLIET